MITTDDEDNLRLVENGTSYASILGDRFYGPAAELRLAHATDHRDDIHKCPHLLIFPVRFSAHSQKGTPWDDLGVSAERNKDYYLGVHGATCVPPVEVESVVDLPLAQLDGKTLHYHEYNMFRPSETPALVSTNGNPSIFMVGGSTGIIMHSDRIERQLPETWFRPMCRARTICTGRQHWVTVGGGRVVRQPRQDRAIQNV